MPEVIIRHPRTGAEYGIQSGDFKRGKHFLNDKGEYVTFEDAGFRIVSLADGSPYEAPAERAQGEHSS